MRRVWKSIHLRKIRESDVEFFDFFRKNLKLSYKKLKKFLKIEKKCELANLRK